MLDGGHIVVLEATLVFDEICSILTSRYITVIFSNQCFTKIEFWVAKAIFVIEGFKCLTIVTSTIVNYWRVSCARLNQLLN